MKMKKKDDAEASQNGRERREVPSCILSGRLTDARETLHLRLEF